MTAILRIGNGVYTPMVEAKAVVPLPPPSGVMVDVDHDVIELELLTIKGPPAVVASAVDALGAHLEEIVPIIGKLYHDQEQPQDGG